MRTTLYEEDIEAVFWDGAEDCAELCFRVLADEPLRQEIAPRHERVLRNNLFNEPMRAAVIDRALRVLR